MLSVTFWKWVRGRLVSEFTEASWSWNNCWSCQQPPCHVPGYRNNPELPEARSTSLAESKLLGKHSSAAFASRLYSLPQSWKPFCEDGLSVRVGSSCFAPAKPKEARLEKQVEQRARTRLSYWKALPLFLICSAPLSSKKKYCKV